MNSFYVFICTILMTMLFIFGFLAGSETGYKKGALAQKNGQITWHTNSVTNVSFTINK